MPAEWSPHEATWLCWPQTPDDWPGKLEAVRWVYAEIVRRLVKHEKVRIIVGSRGVQAQALDVLKRTGTRLNDLEFFQVPSDRSWIRDNGPIFVTRDRARSAPAMVRFRFNGWALYPEWKKDVLVPEAIAEALGLPMFEARSGGVAVTLEGGAIDVNGKGSLIATESCLLDRTRQARNPQLGRSEIETVLRDYLGATHLLWLGRGIEGDETNGHVDDICRFVDENRIVACLEENPKDANYRPLQENWERLQGMRLEHGSRPEVIALPMPEPVFLDGERLPASYANFYIANNRVLVPTFNDPADRTALGIFSELFPDRTVSGIHALDLLSGGGTLHCITQQQPGDRHLIDP